MTSIDKTSGNGGAREWPGVFSHVKDEILPTDEGERRNSNPDLL